MKILKFIFWTFLTVILLSVLGIVILAKYPIRDPKLPPSQFASSSLLTAYLPKLKVTVLETGSSKVPDFLVHRQGGFTKMLKLVHGVILVEHPKGNFLIDTGLGSKIDQQISHAPWIVQKLFHLENKKPLIENEKIKELQGKIDFILLTHTHWDHVSGTLDFPKVPVKMLPEEIAFSTKNPDADLHGVFPLLMEKIKDRLSPVTLQEIPYENFSKSLDLFGDKSVVLVSLKGHTPGSLGIFLNQAPDKRFFVVGDACYALDEKGNPRARSLLMEFVSDVDRLQARETRLKIKELIDHSNEISLVPIHDQAALENLKKAQEQLDI